MEEVVVLDVVSQLPSAAWRSQEDATLMLSWSATCTDDSLTFSCQQSELRHLCTAMSSWQGCVR